MFFMSRRKPEMPPIDKALKGRLQEMSVENSHYVNGNPIKPPFPDGMKRLIVGMGCFWGVERVFWRTPGVFTTAVGYAAGHTPNPTYEEVCSGMTGHNEVVLTVYDPQTISTEEMLRLFWENHDPTQGMRQGNDVGTQYRSGIYCTTPAQMELAEATKAIFQEKLSAAGYGAVTTELLDKPNFFYAEDYHQQYLAKNPAGYCGLGGTGISCPIGVAAA
ncbi:MAG: peptide-methionine (S)-S-oxide reductase MsrA [Rhodospirillaceae bacterium]|nr:peptide-methionine (S)-S-oxide reductase MsrA [Rhodospirillaceae bacterium]